MSSAPVHEAILSAWDRCANDNDRADVMAGVVAAFESIMAKQFRAETVLRKNLRAMIDRIGAMCVRRITPAASAPYSREGSAETARLGGIIDAEFARIGERRWMQFLEVVGKCHAARMVKALESGYEDPNVVDCPACESKRGNVCKGMVER